MKILLFVKAIGDGAGFCFWTLMVSSVFAMLGAIIIAILSLFYFFPILIIVVPIMLFMLWVIGKIVRMFGFSL